MCALLRPGPARAVRTVTIRLLAGDAHTPVLTRRFLRAYPMTLSDSPLNAMTGSVVMQQVALAFEHVDVAQAHRQEGRAPGPLLT